MSYYSPSSYHTALDASWLVHRVRETLETNLPKLQSKYTLKAAQDWKPWLQLELIHHLSQLADRADTVLTGSSRLSSLSVDFVTGCGREKANSEADHLFDLTIRVAANGKAKECHGIILLCRNGAEEPTGFGKRIVDIIGKVKSYDLKHLSAEAETMLSLNIIAVDILDQPAATSEAITKVIGEESVEMTNFEVRKTNDDATKGSLRIWSYKKEAEEEGGQVLLGYATERAVGDLGSGMVSIF
jgi:hypothetical protein